MVYDYNDSKGLFLNRSNIMTKSLDQVRYLYF